MYGVRSISSQFRHQSIFLTKSRTLGSRPVLCAVHNDVSNMSFICKAKSANHLMLFSPPLAIYQGLQLKRVVQFFRWVHRLNGYSEHWTSKLTPFLPLLVVPPVLSTFHLLEILNMYTDQNTPIFDTLYSFLSSWPHKRGQECHSTTLLISCAKSILDTTGGTEEV